MAGIRNLVIVQPYVPQYRLSFFSRLISELEKSNIRCRIAAATPAHHQASRMDAATADWLIPIRQRTLRLGGRTLTLGGAATAWSGADGVIVGHLGSSLDTYRAIFDAKRHRNMRVGLWGHIKPYVNEGNPLDLALERWQLRSANHVFAYSPGGRDYSLSAGVPPAHVTTVMNATDTTALIQARDSVSPDQVQDFMNAHGLIVGHTFGFIGGLDDSKRIGFLSTVLDKLWESDPQARLVVGGRGAQAEILRASVQRGQTIMLGYVDPRIQALMARAVSGLLMPGRIGLVAVDALVLGVPILTTDWPHHAPEAEFLVEGQSRFTSSNNLESFVELIRRFIRQPLAEDTNPRESWNYPTIDNMVSNFSSGVLKMLD